uniref:protein-serine/threonine phosphatase n=1 Tax=Ditylenchus dipsaci TaxID=166011 RepID=A0A915E1C0_9BILA
MRMGEACDHPITIKDFCGVCGSDLRERDGKIGQRKEEVSAIVSMVHQMRNCLCPVRTSWNSTCWGCVTSPKIRPHTASFLEKVSRSYELHIVTFGTKLYAHKIIGMLDPEGKYFHNRILSRDELVSSMYKTKNIKSLFPLGDELLLMIDDRPDVWEYSDALIRVKPYVYFGEIGDINAPLCKNNSL